MLMENVPASSKSIPLMGKYILFTMVMVALSVFLSVVTLNVNFRSVSTHRIPKCTRKLFFQFLPRVLLMSRPIDMNYFKEKEGAEGEMDFFEFNSDITDTPDPYGMQTQTLDPNFEEIYVQDPHVSSTFIGANSSNLQNIDMARLCKACAHRNNHHGAMTRDMIKALKGSQFVAKHLKEEFESKQVSCLTFTYSIFEFLLANRSFVERLTLLLKQPGLNFFYKNVNYTCLNDLST